MNGNNEQLSYLFLLKLARQARSDVQNSEWDGNYFFKITLSSRNMNFEIIQTMNLPYCADSVEWCPIAPYQHYFVCGTYELQNSEELSKTEEKAQVRLGQLHLFSLTKELRLYLNQTVETSAILDIKWCVKIFDDKILFVTANANGKILLWNFVTETETGKVEIVSEFKINNENILSLSVDWSLVQSNVNICVSDSAGYVTILHLKNSNELLLLHRLKLHDYEVWIATFDIRQNSLLYTGADDSVLKITHLETGRTISQLREHTSGVTSIRFHSSQEHIFASGSYDETIKLWDTRHTSKSLSTYKGNGGVWRIKWNPCTGETILTASMYSGFFWFDYKQETNTINLKSELKEHDSIAYGADICFLPPDEVSRRYLRTDRNAIQYHPSLTLTATCSFYDKKLCLCIV